MPKPERHVFVCVQSRPPTHPKGSCTGRGGQEVLQKFAREYEDRTLFGRFGLTSTGCLGPCESGANVLVYPEGVLYAAVPPGDVEAINEKHLLGGEPVERLRIAPEIWG